MAFYRLQLLIVACAMLGVSGCGGRQDDNVVRNGNEGLKSADTQICLSNLKEKSIRFSTLPNQTFSGGCQLVDTVKLLDFGTPTTNLGAMTCPLATTFAAWARHAITPSAKLYLGSEVARIETFGTYSCRNIGGGSSGKLSEHAFGNAVDISTFVLKDGRRVTVLKGWNGDSAEQAFLRRLHQSACKRFGTVLGPDSDAAHADHLHLDMAERRFGGSYCR